MSSSLRISSFSSQRFRFLLPAAHWLQPHLMHRRFYAAIHGTVYGGNQPVAGAHVYLMAATVSGVGSAGYSLASTSLLNSALTGNSDSIGAYVLTDSTGSFRVDAGLGSSIPDDYTCPFFCDAGYANLSLCVGRQSLSRNE